MENKITALPLTAKERNDLINRIAENTALFNCRHALLNRHQVALLCGRSYTGVEGILKDPTFPPPIHVLSAANKTWRCGEVIDWLKNRPRYGN